MAEPYLCLEHPDFLCRWVERKDWAQALFIAVKEAGPFKVHLVPQCSLESMEVSHPRQPCLYMVDKQCSMQHKLSRLASRPQIIGFQSAGHPADAFRASTLCMAELCLQLVT